MSPPPASTRARTSARTATPAPCSPARPSSPRALPVGHLYVVRVARRDDVLARLHGAGIGAGIHYPAPLHLTGAFGHLGKAGDFPVAERLAERILSLPLFPGIRPAQQ